MAHRQYPSDESVAESWRFFREDLGCPRFVAAPMVGKSDLPFRLLLKTYGFDACWTPMFHSEEMAGASVSEQFKQGFGTCSEDTPLIVQFSAMCAADFLEAALSVQDSCAAVDLNLGCPQWKALKGGWGAGLMDEENWYIVRDIVKTAVSSPLLRVPVTVKIRIFDDDRKTIRFAKMIEEAGCSMLTVHGRQRCRELHHAPANWNAIKAVRKALRIPVIANGGISSRARADECLERTGCAAAMIAVAAVANPQMLMQPSSIKASGSSATTADSVDVAVESTMCSQSECSMVSPDSEDSTTLPTSCSEEETEETQERLNTTKHQQLQSVVNQCLRYLDFCEAHPPWSIKGPKEHLRTWLLPFFYDADDLEKVGTEVRSPEPKDDLARRAFWQDLCHEFRICVQSAQVAEASNQKLPATLSANAQRDKNSTDNCAKMLAIGRKVPVRASYTEEQRRKLAALQGYMSGMASSSTKVVKK